MAGTIFINYRRGESLKDAQHLATLIEKHFPHRKVFLDVHGIDGGEHWLHTLERQVAQSDAMLTLIGDGWLDQKDEDGSRRIDKSDDFVRFEISQALQRDIPILPVLIDGAKMPRATQLPENIMELTRFQALPLRTESVIQDAATIAARLKSVLDKRTPPRAPLWITAAAAAIALAVGTAFGAFVFKPAADPGTVQAQLQKAANDLRDANAALGNVTKERNEAKEDLLTALRARDQAVRRLADTETKLSDIEKRVAGAEPELAKARAESEQLRASLATAQKERDQARKDLADANAKIGDLQRLLAQRPQSQDDSRRPTGDRRDPAIAVRPGSGLVFRDRLNNGEPCPVCPEMVVVPSGSFTMGSPPTEPGREAADNKGSEGPTVKITIGKPFAVGRFAVTRGEFAAFVSETGYKVGEGCSVVEKEWTVRKDRSWQSPGFVQDDWHPVVCVSWDDANAYVTWLTNKSGKRYRLLSEAEREYVARAGSVTPFWWGSTISSGQAAYAASQLYDGRGIVEDDRQRTVRVDAFAANPWGLYNVHGNIFEVTDDCWSDTHDGHPADGTTRTTGAGCDRRVVRGGGWRSSPASLRSAFRIGNWTSYRRFDAGLRVARAVEP